MLRKTIGILIMLTGILFGAISISKVLKSMDFTNINTTTNAATFIFCILLIIVGYKIFNDKLNDTQK